MSFFRNFSLKVPISYRIAVVLWEKALFPSNAYQSNVKYISKINLKRNKATLKEVDIKNKNIIFKYEGPFSTALKRVKILSITSCALAFITSPVILAFPNAMPSLSGRIGLASTMCLFGCFTTGLLHWYSSPYIHKLEFNNKTKEFQVSTLNLFAKEKLHKFNLNDIRAPDTMKPMSTFQVDDRVYYIDQNNFSSSYLLHEITKRS